MAGHLLFLATFTLINVILTNNPNGYSMSHDLMNYDIRSKTLHVIIAESLVPHSPIEKGSIMIRAIGFRNSKGVARVTLFDSEKGFPDIPKYALKKATVSIANGNADIAFSEIPFGNYAVGIFHDENSNMKMDKNFLGIPMEGYGASNDARGKLGPPSFEKAEFIVDREVVRIEIKMVY